MSKDYPNKRDCEHGSLRGSCETCDYEQEIAELKSKIAELEKEKQVLIEQHDMWKQQWHELNDSLAIRDLEQQIKAVQYIACHESSKCVSNSKLNCNSIHLADIHNYGADLDLQLKQLKERTK